MKKKMVRSAFLGALLILTTGAVTSCKDYGDDIKNLQEQVNKKADQAAADSEIKKIADLQTALKKEIADADAKAKQALADAKAATDAATKATAEAKAAAELARKAAAEAKTEALAEVAKMVAKDVNALKEEILGQLKGIDSRLVNAEGQIKTAKGEIAAVKKDLDVQVEALKKFKEAVEAQLGQFSDAPKIIERIIKAENDLKSQLDRIVELEKSVKKNGTSIEDIQKTLKDTVAPAIKKINDQIVDINGHIATLHTLIANRLTSITFAPSLFVGGMEAIDFESLAFTPLGNGEESYDVNVEDYRKVDVNAMKYTHSLGSYETNASFYFNPSSFKLANATYSLLTRDAKLRAAGENSDDVFVLVGDPKMNTKTGTVDFVVKRNTDKKAAKGMRQFVALKAALKEDVHAVKDENPAVTSPFILVDETLIQAPDIYIVDHKAYKEETQRYENVREGDTYKYGVTFTPVAKDLGESIQRVWFEFPYDKELNLRDKVAGVFAKSGYVYPLDLDKYGLKYRFSVPKLKYMVSNGDTKTDQQKYFEVVDSVKGIVKATDFNPEAIGRTPIFMAELVTEKGDVVRRAFFKGRAIASKTADIELTINADQQKDVAYDPCAIAPTVQKFSVEEMRDLYRKIKNKGGEGISHTEFWNTYEVDEIKVTRDGKEVVDFKKPGLIDGPTSEGRATKEVVWKINHADIMKIGDKATYIATLTLKNEVGEFSSYPAKITFKFIFNVVLPKLDFRPDKAAGLWNSAGEYVAYVSNPTMIESPTADKAIYESDLAQAYDSRTYYKPPCETKVKLTYEVVGANAGAGNVDNVKAGIRINGSIIGLDKNNNDVKAALNSKDGLVVDVNHIATYPSGDKVKLSTIKVRFMKPLNYTAKTLELTDQGKTKVTVDIKPTLKDSHGNDVDSTSHYWNFYGPFGKPVVKFDFSKATYNGGKLPEYMKFTQNDDKIEYVNDGLNTKLQQDMPIVVPVTVEYGWGKIVDTVKITVKKTKVENAK